MVSYFYIQNTDEWSQPIFTRLRFSKIKYFSIYKYNISVYLMYARSIPYFS